MFNVNPALMTTTAVQKKAYYKRMRQLFGSRLLYYPPLWESSGTTVQDLGPNGLVASYSASGINYSAELAPSKHRAPFFTGTSSYISYYSAALKALLNLNEFSFSCWMKLPTTTWALASDVHCMTTGLDLNNRNFIVKRGTEKLLGFGRKGAGTSSGVYTFPFYSVDWFNITFSVSTANDRARAYINKLLFPDSYGTWGDITGQLDSGFAYLGSASYGTVPCPMYMSDPMFISGEVSQDEVNAINSLNYPTKMTVLGDSISANTGKWHQYVADGYPKLSVINRAVASMGVLQGASNLAAQVTAAAGDDANKVAIALGSNDDNAGNMATLQAAYEAGIDALRLSNPKAIITGLNVLPRWTDVGGGTEVDKSNIRTAIAAACASRNARHINPYGAGGAGIVASDTIDGIHLTAAGSVKYANWLLAQGI